MMDLENNMKSLTEGDFVISTKSGSAALIIALKAVNLPEGSDVIMPSVCCPAVLFAIQFAGYHPVLADVSLDDLCMNVEQIENSLTENTRAIVAVHSFGHYCKIAEIEEFAKEKNIFLIEDACLTLKGQSDNRSLGNFGNVSIFSFGYDKIIDSNGGGVLVTNDRKIIKVANEFVRKNLFFRLNKSDSQMNQLLNKFAQLNKDLKKRKENIMLYEQNLNNDKIKKLHYKDDIIYWRYPALFLGDRDQLLEDAKKEGLIIPKHYKGLHQLMTGVELKNSEYVTSKIINTFVRPEISFSQINDTISFLNGYAA